jgi:hypothetical protein
VEQGKIKKTVHELGKINGVMFKDGDLFSFSFFLSMENGHDRAGQNGRVDILRDRRAGLYDGWVLGFIPIC